MRLGNVSLPLFKGQELGLIVVVVVLSIGFSFVNPNFLTTDNFRNILVAVAVVGIMAIGQCFVIIAKEIDLSVGSVMGLSGLCGAYAMSVGIHPALGILVALAVGVDRRAGQRPVRGLRPGQFIHRDARHACRSRAA